jgi:predicted ATPase
MIESIEIKNFKSIRKKYFPLRNLNLLFGLNGQGKSSFIQALLLLRQSDKLSEGELKLNGGENGLVNIGTTKDALYQYRNKNEKLTLSLQFKKEEPFEFIFNHIADADIFKIENGLTELTKEFITKHTFNSIFSNNFQYLNAQRTEPKSLNLASYSNVIANNLGKYGQFTAHYIHLRGAEPVFFENLIHKNSVTFDSITNQKLIVKTLINQINLWLGEISPGVSVKTNQISSDFVLLEYDFIQPTWGKTNSFKPENVGFGISYALHVITSLLASRPGELIIIENPESHLHPRGQAELGKLIALAAQNDVQIIIESHSDHILNGIRVAVKESSIDKDKVIAFYFKKVVTDNEQYSRITDIKIDKNGTLSDYPENLLNEWSNQLSKLI